MPTAKLPDRAALGRAGRGVARGSCESLIGLLERISDLSFRIDGCGAKHMQIYRLACVRQALKHIATCSQTYVANRSPPPRAHQS